MDLHDGLLPTNAWASRSHLSWFLRIVIDAPTTDCCRIESTLLCFSSRGCALNGYTAAAGEAGFGAPCPLVFRRTWHVNWKSTISAQSRLSLEFGDLCFDPSDLLLIELLGYRTFSHPIIQLLDLSLVVLDRAASWIRRSR